MVMRCQVTSFLICAILVCDVMYRLSSLQTILYYDDFLYITINALLRLIVKTLILQFP